MFQFPGFPPHALCIYASVTGLQPAGFPHSDIKGSMPACGSPLLFAACHVLLRRLVPWHPPCALVRLITSILRLVTLISGQLTFSYCNWSFKTFFLVFLFVQLSRCAGDLSPIRLPSGILKTIQTIEGTVILRTLWLFACALPSAFQPVSFTEVPLPIPFSYRPRFEVSGFPSTCSLERR